MTRSSGRLTAVVIALTVAPVASADERIDAGGALEFSGATWVRVPDAPGLGPQGLLPWCVELWVNLPYSATIYSFLGQRRGCERESGSGWAILYGDPHVSANPFTGTALVPGYSTWFHCAVTMSADSGKIYVDGHLVDAAPYSPTEDLDVALLFGISGTCPFDMGLRTLDEVRIWNVPRSDADIARWYNREVDPATPGLVGYWKFNEPDGSQDVFDSSPAGNHGMLGDGPDVDVGDPRRVRSEVPLLQAPGRRPVKTGQ